MEIKKADFDIVTLDDEIRVDGLCKSLLMAFYESLLADGLTETAATMLANGADHFIRDFVVGVKMLNIFTEQPGIVRQFAGNWYIVNTLDPAVDYLAESLPGVAGFYAFLAGNGLISGGFLKQVEDECADLAYYSSRIDSFWSITGDGYHEWEKGCTLRDVKASAANA